jgi:hypothetical protein
LPQNRFLRSFFSNRSRQSKGKVLSCVMSASAAALLIVAARSVYDYRDAPVEEALAEAKAELYFAEHPGPFCTFEGVWYDWERDETITLGCLEVSDDRRQGRYRSATGPRATTNLSMSGTYDVDNDSCIRVSGKQGNGRTMEFTEPISVDNVEYPTQMIFVDEKGQKGVFIWKRKE